MPDPAFKVIRVDKPDSPPLATGVEHDDGTCTVTGPDGTEATAKSLADVEARMASLSSTGVEVVLTGG